MNYTATIPLLFVKVDETGTPGKRQKWKTHYIMAGCLVRDEIAFAMPTQRRYQGRELKFHDDRNLRIPVIKEARDYVDAVYYVEFCKPKGWHKDEDNQEELENLHKSLLQSLSRGISQDNPGSVIKVVIDHTNLVSDVEARKIVAAESDSNVMVSPSVADSKTDFGLMTNDFFVGAIGFMYNTPNDPKKPRYEYQYSDLFADKITKLPYRDFKEPVTSRNVGNPRCHDPATSRATQTSYGVPTNSPTRGLIGRTNADVSSHQYKIPGQRGIGRRVRAKSHRESGWFKEKKALGMKIGSVKR